MKKIKCNSPHGNGYGMCVTCMDGQQSQGGNTCCTMAEVQEFDQTKILKECEYAEPEE